MSRPYEGEEPPKPESEFTWNNYLALKKEVERLKKLEAVMVQCPYHGEIEDCPNDALTGHIKDQDIIIKGLRDTICVQCQMLAYAYSKKKPNPSCDNCMNGPVLHNPLQKALDRIKELEETKCQACRLIAEAYGACELGKFVCPVKSGVWKECKIGPQKAPKKPDFPDISDSRYKTFADYEIALEDYMIATHDDGRTLPEPKEPLTEDEWTPYADALKIKKRKVKKK